MLEVEYSLDIKRLMEKKNKSKQGQLQYLLSYQEGAARRIQLFIYSVMAADFYALVHIIDNSAILIFIYSLMAAIFSYYCWYLQEMLMCHRLRDNEEAKCTDAEKYLHWLSFITLLVATNLTLIGAALVNGLVYKPAFFGPLIFITLLVSVIHWCNRKRDT